MSTYQQEQKHVQTNLDIADWKRLWILRKKTGKSIADMVFDAIHEYLNKHQGATN